MNNQDNSETAPAAPGAQGAGNRRVSNALTELATVSAVKAVPKRHARGAAVRRRLTKTHDPALYAAIKALERTIQRGIDALDVMRGDPDEEPDADREPSLGWGAPLVQAHGRGEDAEDG